MLNHKAYNFFEKADIFNTILKNDEEIIFFDRSISYRKGWNCIL